MLNLHTLQDLRFAARTFRKKAGFTLTAVLTIKLRHKSAVFADYAVGNVIRHLGAIMAVDVTEKTVSAYQTTRLKEKAAPKTINEEVGFLLGC